MLLLQQLQQAGMVLLQQAGMLLLHQARDFEISDEISELMMAKKHPKMSNLSVSGRRGSIWPHTSGK